MPSNKCALFVYNYLKALAMYYKPDQMRCNFAKEIMKVTFKRLSLMSLSFPVKVVENIFAAFQCCLFESRGLFTSWGISLRGLRHGNPNKRRISYPRRHNIVIWRMWHCAMLFWKKLSVPYQLSSRLVASLFLLLRLIGRSHDGRPVWQWARKQLTKIAFVHHAFLTKSCLNYA